MKLCAGDVTEIIVIILMTGVITNPMEDFCEFLALAHGKDRLYIACPSAYHLCYQLSLTSVIQYLDSLTHLSTLLAMLKNCSKLSIQFVRPVGAEKININRKNFAGEYGF